MARDEKKILISIVGPTASGKTRFAVDLAKMLNTEVLSADSRQFYREMKIGTAKPTINEMDGVTHHFVDSLSIHDEYSVGDYEREAISLLEKLFVHHDELIMVGGSGMFCQAVWQGLDEMPSIASEIRDAINQEVDQNGLEGLLVELEHHDSEYYGLVDKKNPQRVKRAIEVIRTTGKPFSSFRVKKKKQRSFENLKIGMKWGKEALYQRIDHRMDMMIDQGLFEEVKSLMDHQALNALQTVGYSEVFGYLNGDYGYEEAVRLLKRNSRRYAKRQMTWFNKDQEIVWLNPTDLDQALELISNKKAL